jgi:hypothetical protein
MHNFHDGDLCLINSATMHKILKGKKYFEYLTLTKANVTIISGPIDMIKESITANIILPNNTKSSIKNALHSLNPEEIYIILMIYMLMVIILKQ